MRRNAAHRGSPNSDHDERQIVRCVRDLRNIAIHWRVGNRMRSQAVRDDHQAIHSAQDEPDRHACIL